MLLYQKTQSVRVGPTAHMCLGDGLDQAERKLRELPHQMA